MQSTYTIVGLLSTLACESRFPFPFRRNLPQYLTPDFRPNPEYRLIWRMSTVEEQTDVLKSPQLDHGSDNEAAAIVRADSENQELVDPVPISQAGVQKIEAVTSVWTTKSLIIAYAMIWFIELVVLMQQGALVLAPFVTSAFKEHALTPTITVVSSVIGSVFKLRLAKILDIFGRPQGYILSVILATLGLIMMAACHSVQLYGAAQVFYTVGQNALLYTISVFVADTSSLRDRGLMIAFASSPNLITVWLSGPISKAYLDGAG